MPPGPALCLSCLLALVEHRLLALSEDAVHGVSFLGRRPASVARWWRAKPSICGSPCSGSVSQVTQFWALTSGCSPSCQHHREVP